MSTENTASDDQSCPHLPKKATVTNVEEGKRCSYQLQYRKCGKASCKKCRNGGGHGPYWYLYWREGKRVRSKYIGKQLPPNEESSDEEASTSQEPSYLATALVTA